MIDDLIFGFAVFVFAAICNTIFWLWVDYQRKH
jgi:hypothetical protein